MKTTLITDITIRDVSFIKFNHKIQHHENR
jgi:hypothetical protein